MPSGLLRSPKLPLGPPEWCHPFVGADRKIHHFTRRSTIFCISETNPVRRACVFTVTHPYFDAIILALILCVVSLLID